MPAQLQPAPPWPRPRALVCAAAEIVAPGAGPVLSAQTLCGPPCALHDTPRHSWAFESELEVAAAA